MPTISLCMIVKNEENILARCLDSLEGLMDEIIIVDTGSVDSTREIAARYTEQVYDFLWINDFAAARNFAFSKASCDYIYSADADEVLEEENRIKFRKLKKSLLPEIEIVQMYYSNQLSYGTVYNFDKELRPKLFKRNRTFIWTDAIHETIRLEPIVFDSDIEITHLPLSSHAGRDLEVFRSLIAEGREISQRLVTMYAKELMISGSDEDILMAEEYFTTVANHQDSSIEQMKEAACVVVRAAASREDMAKFFRYAMKDIASDGVSEVCMELGNYYRKQKIWEEAIIWYYNAAYETQSILDIHCSGDLALSELALCYEELGMKEQAGEYRRAADEWKTKNA